MPYRKNDRVITNFGYGGGIDHYIRRSDGYVDSAHFNRHADHYRLVTRLILLLTGRIAE